jgi:hypothetical protein
MRERIILEIQRLAQENGKPPGEGGFESATGIVQREWRGKIWGRWGDALRDAGFEPNDLTKRLATVDVIRACAECCKALGRWPSDPDYQLYARNNPGFPSGATIKNHFPKRALLADAVRTWLDQAENSHYAEIANLIPVYESHPGGAPIQHSYGHVYLLRAGDHYKIGQSSDLEKRVKSINVALPDKATLEHAISTDDPPGIEAYWHRSFADRRMNGEWFKLSKADILAFKKRKFQ